ncbi:uncharacterized protein KGF55_002309 [Candida pseudojiufengensis]|uniref:uncharacterized protein n=1 Tax=Candida pseudojiufengensis TaxID=497109 RepID=UPI00222450FB|nr:uncharacterized protein KGF55_002309 [Candida pseudojiufengensis]KAI5964367.1 hypothetical protein KGF55_002309 [Candida pseudojiufengensis]
MNHEKSPNESQLNFKDSTTSSNSISSSNKKKNSSNIWQTFKDSFKPALTDNQNEIKSKFNQDIESLTDLQKINQNTSNSNLRKDLSSRHIQMISLGSSIGTGLFVGTGSALSQGGPGGIMIAWVLTATAVFATMQGLGELCTTFPISGGFNVYASRFIEPGIGFAVGWNYFLQFYVLLPLELVAAAITIQYWNSNINSDVFVIIFWFVIVIITLLGVRGYGEVEFILSTIKVLAVVGFIILGIVLISGGGPNNQFIGGKYWHKPGPFANNFKGVASNIVNAAFSYGGTELVGLTASEANNARKSLPKAIKQVFWRIILFYFGSLVMIACLVPYDDKRLLGSSSVDLVSSPFTIAIVNGGIKGLPSVINAVILLSVLSVGNSSVFACSRSLNSLAEQGMAPKWMGYIDRAGRPLVAIIITNIFGLFALIAANDNAQQAAFDWLLALSGLSTIFTWLTINLSHIRFRSALKSQGRSINELPYVSQTGIWGSYYGLILNFLFLIAQFWIALFPLGSKPNAYDFFLSYLGFPVTLAFWIGYKIWKRNLKLYLKSNEIDIDSGRIEIDIDVLQQELAEERTKYKEMSIFKKCFAFWC